jgi:hypothetical protein
MGTTVEFRQFNEDKEDPLIKMRVLAIWEAQEAMERGASETDNPSAFLASVDRRTETAFLIMIQEWRRRSRRESEGRLVILPTRRHIIIIHLLGLAPDGWLASPNNRAWRGLGSAHFKPTDPLQCH